jgi:hypothetical protein
MNDPKAPQFLTDLVQDLRDRRLLPLIAVLAIAIVAVPFALAQSDSSQRPSATTASGPALASVSASQLNVVSESPGLRDYGRRLGNLTPKDPFEQPAGAAGGGASGTSATSAATVVSTTGSSAEGGSSGGGSGSSTGGGSASPTTSSSESTTTNTSTTSDQGTSSSPGLHYFTFRIDAAVGEEGDVKVRRGLDYMTLLPDKNTPLAMYVGVDINAKQALFLVSGNVARVAGGKCLMRLAGGGCQLLGLREGDKAELLFSNDKFGTSYSKYVIHLLQIHLHPTSAPRAIGQSVGRVG